MQKTRQKILEYLRKKKEATVGDLSTALGDLTAVTIRHHLDVLREEGFVAEPDILHRDTPGRPKYVYRLTSRADGLFEDNMDNLTVHIISEMKETLPEQQFNVIFEGVADRMAAELDRVAPDETLEKRLIHVVDHLIDQGYGAEWEETAAGFVLHTTNCPYNKVAVEHDELCQLDMRYISKLLGVVPRQISSIQDGAESCSYLIPAPEKETVN